MTLDSILSIAALIGIAISVLAAYKHDARLQAKHSDVKSYKWGYFLGYFSIIPFTMLLIIVEIAKVYSDQQPSEDVQELLNYTIPYGILGIFVILRFRLALILHTLYLMNPVIWIINGFYLKNRWHELKKVMSVGRKDSES
ncbi:hypothetical protein DPQ33_08520 [Oceanidesulfovibrio indonesiensis]|uniref:Uncharacterized protein n=1 Tax=Oceanidesulfovibrio indonesiensis TaxID=54767 RepID=A0A7M3MGB0_9BACT|nr:hypothetical protein [Oceanidesulfovibrio indonesiensis]TVM17674.1 hypothetical protein DPQ33_08520 [Oceanidesulfovibrio indonesiensis]